MGSLKQNVWLKLENNFNKKKGGYLIKAMSTDACWVRQFCVEPGIFVSNHAFCCRTGHFAVESGFCASNECYNKVLDSTSHSDLRWRTELITPLCLGLITWLIKMAINRHDIWFADDYAVNQLCKKTTVQWQRFCGWINLLHKFYNATYRYPTKHHFVTEMRTCVHISAPKWCTMGCMSISFGIGEIGLLVINTSSMSLWHPSLWSILPAAICMGVVITIILFVVGIVLLRLCRAAQR